MKQCEHIPVKTERGAWYSATHRERVHTSLLNSTSDKTHKTEQKAMSFTQSTCTTTHGPTHKAPPTCVSVYLPIETKANSLMNVVVFSLWTQLHSAGAGLLTQRANGLHSLLQD